MIRKNIKGYVTSIDVNDSLEGETIEEMLDRVMNNGEPISETAPRIYTARNEGVRPEYNIRTDKMEIALDYTDVLAKSAILKREEYYKEETKGPEESK